MADVRIANHQQFDLLRCKLCTQMYDDPRLLSCLHSFCCGCLRAYIAENNQPSDTGICCPLCKEVTSLPASGNPGDLLQNTLLTKYILQTQRDKTMQVAGREVLALQRQAFTESELQQPEIVASIQHIAQTAGQVIASSNEEQNKVHGYDTAQTRRDLQTNSEDIQKKSVSLVFAIDEVNRELEDWFKEKKAIRDQIRKRSSEIQEQVQGIEKLLLARLDSPDLEQDMKNESFAMKSSLHKTLQGSLMLADFLKLLMEYGDKEELEKYSPLVNNQEDRLLNRKINTTRNSFTFDFPQIDLEDALMMMFGTLSEVTEEKTVWDPNRIEEVHKVSGETVEEIEDVVESSPMVHKYKEINDNSCYKSNNDDSEFGSRYSKRFETETGTPKKVRRRPLKSMSFDSGTTYSNYLLKKKEGGKPMLRSETDTVISDSSQETENQADSNGGINKHEGNENLIPGSNKAINSAYKTLLNTSNLKYPGLATSWSRRYSAPNNAINMLTRRRLSALSILERANINTEGINLTSDVESGLNEARLEWLRENVRRKMSAQRSDSIEEQSP